jgi:hypothetical protein
MRIKGMKHLLNGVAIAAALAIAGPVWAQSPTGGNPVGSPGPSPGGPGLTPYSGGAPTAAPTEAPTSATPPMHHAHVMHHAHAMHAFHKGMAKRATAAGDTTAALNREELARIQAGNFSNPPAPPPEEGAPPPEEAAPGSSSRIPGPKPSSGAHNIP